MICRQVFFLVSENFRRHHHQFRIHAVYGVVYHDHDSLHAQVSGGTAKSLARGSKVCDCAVLLPLLCMMKD